MKQYLDLLDKIRSDGIVKSSRTGKNTHSIFGHQMRFNLHPDNFPVLTTKRVYTKAVISELLWMIEGSGDERRLAEIHYGSRDMSNKTIWTENAFAPYWIAKANFPGDCGRIYGVQWRSWQKYRTTIDGTVISESIDQLQNIINTIKTDPDNRRIILSSWNVSDLDQMCLPPCHMMAQFNVEHKKLNCLMYQRSADVPLGTPFNIIQYSLLTSMIAQVCNLVPGELVYTVGDAHIYEDQMEGVITQLSRTPRKLPKLKMNPSVRSIDGFKMDDFEFIDYDPHPVIKFPFAV